MAKPKNITQEPAAAPDRPNWKQTEMFPLEEYPTSEGVAKYQASRGPDELSADEVRSIRRAGKLKQDLSAMARGFKISSRACADVAALRERAEVPSDFETEFQARQRMAAHKSNLNRKGRQARSRGEG